MKALRYVAVVVSVMLLGACATQLAPHAKVPGTSSASVAAASPTPVPASVAPASTRTFAASSGYTVEGKMEALRHSLDGTRVAGVAAGSYAGKNVIIIQVESLDGLVVDHKYNGREITPNINKLLKSSFYWSNGYSNTGMGNTADAEFITNSSLPTPSDQAATVKYANRTMPGLPRLMRGAGYYAFTIHPNKATYWNRKQMYWELGFNKYYDRAFFKGAPFMGEFGASDEELFKRGLPLLTALSKKSTPFLSEFVTLSSHGPFLSIPESKRPFRTPPELAGSVMGKYMSAESYSDYALGKFFKSLQSAGLWDNTMIVIYGDHTALPSNSLSGKDAAAAKKLLGRSYNAIDRQRVPIIFHLPGQTNGLVLGAAAGQVDIMPTVADLVGIDLRSVPHVGRSLFLDSNPLVPFNAYLPGGSIMNARVLFMPGKGSRKAAALKIPAGGKTAITSTETADASRFAKLWKLSDSWIMSLPKFKSGPPGWIPDPIARAAAAKYGFPQH